MRLAGQMLALIRVEVRSTTNQDTLPLSRRDVRQEPRFVQVHLASLRSHLPQPDVASVERVRRSWFVRPFNASPRSRAVFTIVLGIDIRDFIGDTYQPGHTLPHALLTSNSTSLPLQR